MTKRATPDRILGIPTSVLTVLITVLGTIIVAAIGVLPALRKQDQTEIKSLSAKVVALENQLKQNTATRGAGSTLTIKGTIHEQFNGERKPVPDAFVVLFPVDKAYSQSSDDEGKFTLTNVAPGPYFLFLSVPTLGVNSRVIINAEDRLSNEKLFSSLVFDYKIDSQ